MRSSIFLAVVIMGSCCWWSAASHALAGRKLLADSEGAALTGIVPYLTYVDKKCGDPAKATGECLNLLNQFCGTRDTSEVICRKEEKTAQFRSASRYTRVGYLRCSLTQAICYADAEGADRDAPKAAVDPRSLAAWYQYNAQCSKANYNPAKVSASTCANLSGQQCSRADVKCNGDITDFFDILNPSAKRAVFRGDTARGLVFFVPQTTAKTATVAAAGAKSAGAKKP